jgi:hypothetical protein
MILPIQQNIALFTPRLGLHVYSHHATPKGVKKSEPRVVITTASIRRDRSLEFVWLIPMSGE